MDCLKDDFFITVGDAESSFGKDAVPCSLLY